MNKDSIAMGIGDVKRAVLIRALQYEMGLSGGVTQKVVISRQMRKAVYKVHLYEEQNVGFYAVVTIYEGGEVADEFTVRATDVVMLLDRLATLTGDNDLIDAILL